MRIRFYGRLAEAIGREIEVDAATAGETVGALREALADLHPEAATELRRTALRACIDDTIVSEDRPLAGAAIVEFFPPLSGG